MTERQSYLFFCIRSQIVHERQFIVTVFPPGGSNRHVFIIRSLTQVTFSFHICSCQQVAGYAPDFMAPARFQVGSVIYGTAVVE